MLPVLGQAECKFLSGEVELIAPSFKNMNRWNLLTHTVPRTVPTFSKKGCNHANCLFSYMVAVLVLDPYSFELLLTMSRNCQNSVKDPDLGLNLAGTVINLPPGS